MSTLCSVPYTYLAARVLHLSSCHIGREAAVWIFTSLLEDKASGFHALSLPSKPHVLNKRLQKGKKGGGGNDRGYMRTVSNQFSLLLPSRLKK